MTLEEMRAAVAAAAEELRTLDSEIGENAPTDEQAKKWEETKERHAKAKADLDAAEKRLKDRRSLVADLADKGSTEPTAPEVMRRVDPFDGTDVRSLTRQSVRDKALKALDTRDRVDHLGDEARSVVQERVARLLRTQSRNVDGAWVARMLLATENDHYRTAFMKLVARGGQAYLTPEEGRALEAVNEIRAMSLSDSAGGYGVPVLIDPTIILTAQGHPNDFLAISRVENITNDEWKGVTSAGATSYWTTEGVAITDGSPTLAQPNVPTKRLTTYVEYSFEIGGDYPSFASEISLVMAESRNEKLVESLTTGLGTTAQPTGIVTALEAAAGSQVAVTTDGQLNPADLYKLWDALPIRFRNNARWMSSTSVMNAVRQFAAGASSGGDANFTVNLLQEAVPRLFGKPYHLNDYMDDAVGTGNVTSASDVSLIIVGDWRHFLIANRVGATVEQVQHVLDTTTGTPTGERGLLMWSRIGSDSIVDNAFRILTQD